MRFVAVPPMNFDYSDEQVLLKDQARKFLSERCTSARVRAVLDDASRHYDADLWKGVIELGWLGVAIPEQFGGRGWGESHCAPSLKNWAVRAPRFLLHRAYGAAEALLLAGSREQQERLLPALISGDSIGSLAF